MSQFELLRNVTIGQYIPTGSFIHQLDPRSKIAVTVFLIIAISTTRAVVPVLLLLGLIILINRISRIPFDYLLRGVILGLPILVLVFAVQLIFQGWADPPGRIYFEWWWLRLTRYSVQLITVGVLRIIALIFVTSLLTLTTTITELTHGIERILDPFRRFGVPSHELALINMIALRFVPTFAEEMERVMKAQASRCADLDDRRFYRPDKAAKAYLPLIVPLFINAFRRAEELVLAMEARCYIGGGKRTKYITLHSKQVDYLVSGGMFILLLVMVLFPWPSIRMLMLMLGLPDIF